MFCRSCIRFNQAISCCCCLIKFIFPSVLTKCLLSLAACLVAKRTEVTENKAELSSAPWRRRLLYKSHNITHPNMVTVDMLLFSLSHHCQEIHKTGVLFCIWCWWYCSWPLWVLDRPFPTSLHHSWERDDSSSSAAAATFPRSPQRWKEQRHRNNIA